MKNLSRSLTSFAVVIILVSCFDSQVARIEKELIESDNDSTVIILPNSFRSVPYLKEVQEKWSRTLGLHRIEEGSSETVLRTWEDLKTFNGHVFIITNKKGGWEAEMYNYKYNVTVG